ncbi:MULTISPECIES: Acg family FMN-binding oxidoreductase [Mycolicibacterium]|uniref:Acg family FMN-binding oxidoreductase n=1 Tax=Mycolicibacterium TaxID=1866885 RepID=UPI00148FA4F7|nr:NAD(P)H nitroreductase [Mycolicibacterium fortuitum]
MTTHTVSSEVISRAVELASRAPSLHNSQPWRWVDHGTHIDLFVDSHRVVRSTDSSGREAILSCGAMLDHFRVAMAAAGWTSYVDCFPNPNRLEHLASIDFSPLSYVTPAWTERAGAIPRRRSDRLPLYPPPDWGSLVPVLRRAVNGELATLEVLADDARHQLAEASRLTESLRRYDEFYHREMQWWTTRFRQDEGLPDSALVSASERDRVGVDRAFPISGHTERRSSLTHDQAKIVVLLTREDTERDAFECGQALSAVLLEATLAGLATCPLTHITETESSRQVLRELIGTTAMPQVLVRIGAAPQGETAPPATPRRPITDILEFRR